MAANSTPEPEGEEPPFSLIWRGSWKHAIKLPSRHAFVVWGIYVSYADRKTGLAWPSKVKVAKAAGFDPKRVREAVLYLSSIGWMEDLGPKPKYRNCRIYRVNLDPPAPPTDKLRVARKPGSPQPGSTARRSPAGMGSEPGCGTARTRQPAAANPILIRPEDKTKICAEAALASRSAEGEPDPDRPPGSGPGPDAGEREERKAPTPSGRSSRQELAHQVVHGSKSELWQAISAAGIRLGGRDRFRFLAQEEQTRQAVAYLLEQGRRRKWPADPAAFLVWAWSHVGGRGAESLAQLRKAGFKLRPHATARPISDTMDGVQDFEADATGRQAAEQRRIQAEQEQRLADEISRQAIKRPWTQAEKDLQARLDEERARARQALGL